MAEDVKDAKRTANDAVQKTSELSFIMSNILQILKDLKLLIGELKEELADGSQLLENLQRMSTFHLQINREKTIGRQGRYLRYPVHIVMLICEILVNRTPPSAIPANIQTISAAITGSEVN